MVTIFLILVIYRVFMGSSFQILAHVFQNRHRWIGSVVQIGFRV